MREREERMGVEFWPLPLEKINQAQTDTDSGASEGKFGACIWTDADSGASVQ